MPTVIDDTRIGVYTKLLSLAKAQNNRSEEIELDWPGTGWVKTYFLIAS